MKAEIFVLSQMYARLLEPDAGYTLHKYLLNE